MHANMRLERRAPVACYDTLPPESPLLTLLSSLALAGAWAYQGQVTESSPYYDVEKLYTDSDYAKCKERALQRIAQTPSDAELYWLAARCQFELAELHGRDEKGVDKLAMYEEMLELCDKGLALAPEHPHLYFARSAAVGRIGTTKGVLASLFTAKEIEDGAKRALDGGYTYRSLLGKESLPTDAHLVLGIFYRLVPESWVVKVLAGTRGDLSLSIEHLETAQRLEPRRIDINKELGVSRLCYAQRRQDAAMAAKGVEALSFALTIPPMQPTDETDIRHIATILGDPSLACGYSRDGQQEVEDKQVEEWAKKQGR
jgi:tetratricopeptide (TPR) repeat protein